MKSRQTPYGCRAENYHVIHVASFNRNNILFQYKYTHTKTEEQFQQTPEEIHIFTNLCILCFHGYVILEKAIYFKHNKSTRRHMEIIIFSFQCTELPRYNTQLQMAVARGLGLPAGRLAGPHTDAAPKRSQLFQFSFRVDGHAHRHTFAKRKR